MSAKPLPFRSYAVDVMMPGCSHVIQAELYQSRAGLSGAAVADPADPSGNTMLLVLAGGEIRTKWRLPDNLAGADFVTDAVDVLRASTKNCKVVSLNTMKEFH